MGIAATSYSQLNRIIESVDPAALQGLREKYPDQASLFSLYKDLGEDDGNAAGYSIEALRDLARLAATANGERLNQLLQSMRSRLARIRNYQTIGTILTALLGVLTAVMAYREVSKQAIALVAGIFTPLSALGTKLLDAWARSPSGESLADPAKYAEMVQLSIDNQRLTRELEQTPFNQPTEASLAKTYAALMALSDGLLKYDSSGI